MVRVEDHQLQDRDQEENERRDIERDQNGGQGLDNQGVTITEVEDVGPPGSVVASSLDDRGYGTEALCARSVSDVQMVDEDVSCTSSTQYSDVDDSLEGDELGSWSNDLGLPVSLQQNFDNGVSLPVGEAPTFGDVCVKNSANIHFGNKTFYNGPVTIKQIVYATPVAVEEKNSKDDNNKSDNPAKERTDYQTSREFHKGGPDECEFSETKDATNSNSATKWCNWMVTWRCVALICALGSCLVATVVMSVVFLSRAPISNSSQDAGDSSINTDVLPQNKLNFIERVAWVAQPPNEPVLKLNLPVPYVVISHTATVPCSTQSECTYRVRLAQTYDIESQNWTDIGCNFLIGGDGYAYVGRGWDVVGDGLQGYNHISIGICFIGTFNTVKPPKLQLLAARQLIELGVKDSKISPKYKLLALRQIAKNLNPGEALYSIIKTWPNWSSELP